MSVIELTALISLQALTFTTIRLATNFDETRNYLFLDLGVETIYTPVALRKVSTPRCHHPSAYIE